VCPSCGAPVEGKDVPDIPGVTSVDSTAEIRDDEGFVPDFIDPGAWYDAGRDGLIADESAIAPPGPEVAREIERMKLEAEIDNAGQSVIATNLSDFFHRFGNGDETIDAREPSPEAEAAFEAGLLGNSGSAEEAELAERAEGLEIDKQV
jgi:hypothetical protein